LNHDALYHEDPCGKTDLKYDPKRGGVILDIIPA
jgi:hypothetical protein